MRSKLTLSVVLVSVLSAAAALALSPAGSPAAGTVGISSPGPPPRLISAADRIPAPAFSEPVLGRPHLAYGPASFAGDVVVLAFWSSWCIPCRTELRQLETAWRARPPGSVILGVDVDDGSSPAASTVRSAGVTFDNLIDAESSAANAYRIAGTPTIIFVDSLGREAAVVIGPTPTATILDLLRHIIPGPTGSP